MDTKTGQAGFTGIKQNKNRNLKENTILLDIKCIL